MKKILFILIFILFALIAVVFWVYQRNIYSKDVLKLEILGSEKIMAGEELEYILKYKNNGNARLEELELIFEYPDDILPIGQDSHRIVRELEDLYPGQEEIIYFQGRLFGRKGEVKTAAATLSYRPKSLKAVYESKSTFSTVIEDVPITFAFDLPSKIVADKETKISLNYFSNLDGLFSGLRIKIDYPDDFEFGSSTPEGIEKDEWSINILNKAEGGRIEVFGKIPDDIGNQKVFNAQLGVWLADHFVPLKEITRAVQIIRPQLIITQRINGATNYIVQPGELLHYEISFKNIGDEFFENLFLISEFDGPLDLKTAKVQNGEINASDGSILWDWNDVSKLRFLGPGEEGVLEFWVNLQDVWDPSDYRDSVLINNVSLSQIKEEFRTKINSKLEIVQKGFFEDKTFDNSGPLPPRVGEKTTYTITWEVKNHFNDVDNVRVRAVLPSNVELVGNISPQEEQANFTFDSVSREVLWNVGFLNVGVGVDLPQKSLAFQIELTPSENQRGLVATLINSAKIIGEDKFTQKELEIISADAIDTTLPHDASVEPEQGIIQ